MTKKTERLTAMQVGKLTKPGLYPDGLCLYLQVSGTAGKSWLFRPKIRGKRRDIGLGSVSRDEVTLSKARKLAAEMRTKLAAGWDPIEARNEAKTGRDTQLPTFSDCARDYIEAKKAEWKNAKHPQQWENTLREYCFPFFGSVPVRDVNKGHVLQALEAPVKDRDGSVMGRFWTSKSETASRVRNRIELVLDYAKARDLRDGENPARWKGNLKLVLPAPTKVRPVQHQPAMPFKDCPAFVRQLLSLEPCSSGLALAFCILTATRTGELITARWRDVDLVDGLWRIPADRRKGPKGEERALAVPLSFEALTVLVAANDIRQGEYVFPGGKARSPLSSMALLEMLRGLGVTDAVVHGFRSSFRDWASECTDYANHVCEAALGHVIPDGVEGAYRRGDLLEKRRGLMQAWANFLLPVKNATNVVDLRAA